MRQFVIAALSALAIGACSAPDAAPPRPATAEQRFPDVVEVAVTPGPGGATFDVTISSPYDSPQRYADAFRVRSADGDVYGVRELDHDHATEQPFTRSLPDVALPEVITEVVVEARDSRNGWGGGARTVSFVPTR